MASERFVGVRLFTTVLLVRTIILHRRQCRNEKIGNIDTRPICSSSVASSCGGGRGGVGWTYVRSNCWNIAFTTIFLSIVSRRRVLFLFSSSRPFLTLSLSFSLFLSLLLFLSLSLSIFHASSSTPNSQSMVSQFTPHEVILTFGCSQIRRRIAQCVCACV